MLLTVGIENTTRIMGLIINVEVVTIHVLNVVINESIIVLSAAQKILL